MSRNLDASTVTAAPIRFEEVGQKSLRRPELPGIRLAVRSGSTGRARCCACDRRTPAISLHNAPQLGHLSGGGTPVNAGRLVLMAALGAYVACGALMIVRLRVTCTAIMVVRLFAARRPAARSGMACVVFRSDRARVYEHTARKHRATRRW